jgi:multidrug resistance efflux pump
VAQEAGAEVDLHTTKVRAPANLAEAQAQLAQARANLAQSDNDSKRQHGVDPRATTQTNVDQATTAVRSNAANVQSAEAQVSVAALVKETIETAEATLKQRKAQVEQARANLAQAKLNLSYTDVTAPQDGQITRRNVDLGTFAQAGEQVFYLVTRNVWVVANYKETQLDRMRVGQRVDIKVDAYPDLHLSGHVESIQGGSGARFTAFPAENATGNFVKIVRRVPVKILIDHGLENWPFLPLGLSVEPTVYFNECSRGNPNLWLIAIVVTMGAFMEVLDTTIVNVALPHIAGSLAISNDESTWSLTTYLVANAIVLTISGNLSMRLGQKNYFLLSVAGFTVASLLCGISTNFVELLVFRAVQGFFGGGLQPTQQAIILDTFPPEKRQTAFSITAIATIVAPALGPVVGGYLTDQLSWHWIFLVNIPIGIGTFFGVMHLVEESPESKRRAKRAPPFDYWGWCSLPWRSAASTSRPIGERTSIGWGPPPSARSTAFPSSALSWVSSTC